ncbi:MAG: hypothetical protein ACR2NA_04810 [Solirubrobacterales bacterium]
MSCAAAIDIGSNTTRLLVAELDDGRLKAVLEQRAYTRIKAASRDGKIGREKVAEVAEVLATQVRLAEELGVDRIDVVATAAIRDARNGVKVARRLGEAAGVDVTVLSERQEGEYAFIGATKTLGAPAEGTIAVVDVGGGSTEVVVGTVEGGVDWLRSVPVGSAELTEDFLTADPPAPSELRDLREAIGKRFAGLDVPACDQAVAVGGSATSLRKLVGGVLEYETLERSLRLLTGDPVDEVAVRFDLDPRRVRMLPAGALLLEHLSAEIGMPLVIGKGGLREGIVLSALAPEPLSHAA